MKKLLISALSLLLLITSVFSLSACNTVKKYEITFVVNEKVYSKVETAGNEEIEFPATPTLSGYTFKGWFVDKDSWTEELTPDTLKNRPLEENLTVYAWLEEKEQTPGEETTPGGSVTPDEETTPGGSVTPDEETHTHTYNKQVISDKYIKSSATCKAKAVYYYSCECGKKGTEPFEYGELGGHDYVSGKCSVCSADDPSIELEPAPTGPYCVDKTTWTQLLSYCTNGKVKVAPKSMPEYTIRSLDGNKGHTELFENNELVSEYYTEEEQGTYYTYQVVGSDWQKVSGDAGPFLECSMFVNMGTQFKDSFDSFTYDEDENCYVATNLQAQGTTFDSVKIYFENGAFKGLECSGEMFIKIYDVGSTTITLPTVK